MDALRKIADAVLYEGYVLWPYRRSALKNTRRFTFGGVTPDAPMRTEVLLGGRPGPRPRGVRALPAGGLAPAPPGRASPWTS